MFGSTRNRNVDKHCLRTSTFKDGPLRKEDVKNAFKALGLSPPDNKTFASLSDVDENGNRYIGEDKTGELVKYVMKRG
ncbi:hypothetical protein PTKIN_Ptkin08bG0014200 [Pterospermum kingtungense]